VPSRYARLDAVLREKLHTWQLSPTEKRSKLWELSSYEGMVVVRAESSIQARKLVAQAFCRDGSMATDRLVESPWLSTSLARCEISYDPRYDAVDTPGVVDPRAGDLV
jgi:hypothetical protein